MNYSTHKKTGLELILKGVKLLATNNDHAKCKTVLESIALIVKSLEARELYEMRVEQGLTGNAPDNN